MVHVGIFGKLAMSTKVGNKSISSTGSSITLEPVFGIWMIRGTRVATSKLLNFDHSPCSPKDQPAK